MRDGIGAAFVLGAGLGTRLRPLTEARPKPLIPIYGKPLITFALDHLCALGVRSFVINTHHLAGQFEEAFAAGNYAGRPLKLVHEPVLLETGGGIRNAQPWLGGGPFLVYSGDILTDMPLELLVEEHFRRGNDVTLALRETGLAAGITLENGRVTGIRKKSAPPGGYDFANVSVWNPGIFQRIADGRIVSFIPVLAEWLGQGGKIGGVVLPERQWFNIGSRAEYLAVHRFIHERSWRPAYGAPADWPEIVSPAAKIGGNVKLSGFHAIGPGCVVGEGAQVRDSVLWGGAEIASRAQLEECIIRDGRRAEGILRGADI